MHENWTAQHARTSTSGRSSYIHPLPREPNEVCTIEERLCCCTVQPPPRTGTQQGRRLTPLGCIAHSTSAARAVQTSYFACTSGRCGCCTLQQRNTMRYTHMRVIASSLLPQQERSWQQPLACQAGMQARPAWVQLTEYDAAQLRPQVLLLLLKAVVGFISRVDIIGLCPAPRAHDACSSQSVHVSMAPRGGRVWQRRQQAAAAEAEAAAASPVRLVELIDDLTCASVCALEGRGRCQGRLQDRRHHQALNCNRSRAMHQVPVEAALRARLWITDRRKLTGSLPAFRRAPGLRE